MSWRWLFFDADGTLFDFAAAQASALERAWEAHGLPLVPDLLQRYQAINIPLWQRYEQGEVSHDYVRNQRFVDLLAGLGSRPGLASEVSSAFTELLGRQAQLLDGATELLEDLSRDRSLALVTNGLAEVQRGRVGRSGVEQHFGAVVISGEVGAAKPSSAFFDAAFRACGNPALHEVLIIGDSLSSDIQGGHDYGIATCWFNPEGRALDPSRPAPDYVVADYAELRRLVRE